MASLELKTLKCDSCGGPLTRIGNCYVCDYCELKWVADLADDIHAVERANAWEALRQNDFEKAAELFENILLKDPKNAEAYWGRALAVNDIVYETDYNEHKKVPTCNNITEESFLNNSDVKKALAFAMPEIKESYQKQAEQIEKIRVEWLQKASKEPPYDIFISFKDSDREHGIERTQDSIDAQDLYNALVAEGYKVFFSRISLRDKISEQFEPYIYNAIKTAKVMIVFGEKPEYFNAVWIKNEWSRFKTRIEKGEKHKNSLVVVYKRMDPNDLPVVLKSRQCLNAEDMTFLSLLTKHVKRVIDETSSTVHLDKIEIKGGKIGKKSAQIKTETIKTREIGAGAVADVDVTETQSLQLAYTYLKSKQWADADKILDDILFNNPNCPQALVHKLYPKYEVSTDAELVGKMNSFSREDFNLIARALSCADSKYAAAMLDYFYSSGRVIDGTAYSDILKIVLPYDYPQRGRQIEQAFGFAIEKKSEASFNELLKTIDSKDVDKYIDYNLKFAKALDDGVERSIYLKNVREVDEGNLEVLRLSVGNYLVTDNLEKAVETFEKLLQYTSDGNQEIHKVLASLSRTALKRAQCEFAKQVLRYYDGDISEIKNVMLDVAYCMLGNAFFDEAKYLLGVCLSFDKQNDKIYWGICLAKIKAKAETDVVNSDILLKEIPEYTKYLIMVNEKRRLECIELVKRQENAIEARRRKAENAKKEAKDELMMKKVLKTVLIIAAIAIVGAVLLGVFGVLKWETVGVLMSVVPGSIVGLIFYGAIIRAIIIKPGITKNSNENEESSKITGSENLSALKESLNNLKDDLKGLLGK